MGLARCIARRRILPFRFWFGASPVVAVLTSLRETCLLLASWKGPAVVERLRQCGVIVALGICLILSSCAIEAAGDSTALNHELYLTDAEALESYPPRFETDSAAINAAAKVMQARGGIVMGDEDSYLLGVRLLVSLPMTQARSTTASSSSSTARSTPKELATMAS